MKRTEGSSQTAESLYCQTFHREEMRSSAHLGWGRATLACLKSGVPVLEHKQLRDQGAGCPWAVSFTQVCECFLLQ